MSDEQADNKQQVIVMSDEQADNKQQVTAPTATAPRLKNPKRVEAGKINAEKNRKAREAQKKALAEAEAKC